jgi:hypothetical protein
MINITSYLNVAMRKQESSKKLRTLFNKKRICLYLHHTTQINYEIQKNSSETKW